MGDLWSAEVKSKISNIPVTTFCCSGKMQIKDN